MNDRELLIIKMRNLLRHAGYFEFDEVAINFIHTLDDVGKIVFDSDDYVDYHMLCKHDVEQILKYKGGDNNG